MTERRSVVSVDTHTGLNHDLSLSLDLDLHHDFDFNFDVCLYVNTYNRTSLCHI